MIINKSDKYLCRIISSNNTIIESLKKMDEIGCKLLIVAKKNKFISLLSIGDIQRAIINNIPLETKIESILRKSVKVAYENEFTEQIKEMMFNRRTELMPVIDKEQNIIDVLFWEDLFDEKKISPLKKFKLPIVIMAGGYGTRLKPLTNILPKPLIPIGEKTITEHIIDNFSQYGCNKFLLSLNYKADIIEYYLNNKNLNIKLKFFREEIPLGTAGSLQLMKDDLEDTFFVSNCDILIEQDYSEILDYHFNNQNDITIVAALKNYSIPYGIVKTIENGILSSIEEKPDLTFKINSGMYILQKSTLDSIPSNRLFHITELIESIQTKGGKIGVFPVTEKSWKDIGDWKEYLNNINIKH